MPRNKRAFTLVELLIVIGIIALLVGLTLPTLYRAVAIARSTACKTNLHAVGVGLRMYLDQNDDIMPLAAQMPSEERNDYPRIADVLEPFIETPNTLKCPADRIRTFFAEEGSSYEYHQLLGGRKVSDSFLSRRWGEQNVPVMNDYEPFHGEADQPGAMNYLFADGHVGDLGEGDLGEEESP
jgi:prepilin-type N-terminal cleavage/methylation domain-containing protein/prepilin-type processing-associated H-X9-DG protein